METKKCQFCGEIKDLSCFTYSYRNYCKECRIKYNELSRLKNSIRSLISSSFRKKGFTKNSKSEKILGCSFIEFKLHLESKFDSWMTWDNYSLYNKDFNFGWEIDHIIPISSAKTIEDIIKLNHFSNLQPLDSYINRKFKRGKTDWEMENINY
jgi:hypothetical protein